MFSNRACCFDLPRPIGTKYDDSIVGVMQVDQKKAKDFESKAGRLSGYRGYQPIIYQG